MSKTTESDIYKLIKKAVINLKLNCFLTRIESGLTLSGIPDLYVVYYSNLINKTVNKPVAFWLELKSNNLKNCNVSKYQINWILKHNKAGGIAYILNRPVPQGGLKLYSVDHRAVVTEVFASDYSVTGIANVLKWVADKHCIA
jgi:hypothetical protein